MPLDLTPSEFSSADEDEAPEIPTPHDENGSTLLGAMKKAGNALVKTAKRVARKPVLSTMMAAGAVLCAPQVAQACPAGEFAANGFCYAVGSNIPSGLDFGGNNGGGWAGDPVQVSTGNVFLHVVDYTTAGPNPLQFIRYYNSMAEPGAVSTLAYSFGNVDNGYGTADFTLRAPNPMGGLPTGTPRAQQLAQQL